MNEWRWMMHDEDPPARLYVTNKCSISV